MERKISKMIYIAIITIACYLFFMIWLANGIANYSSNDNPNYYPNVSIIISAHNEENNLPILLYSLIKQDYADGQYEIIIANDR